MHLFTAVLRVGVILPVLACVTVVSGCGRLGQKGLSPSSYGPNDLVLRVEYVGGETLVYRQRLVSVYGDGRVIAKAAVPKNALAPALPNLVVNHLGPASLDLVVRRAIEHGVGHGLEVGQDSPVDAPNTAFTVLTADGPKTAYANPVSSPDGPTAEQRSASRELLRLRDDLMSLSTIVGVEQVDAPRPYTPVALGLIFSYSYSSDPNLPIPWREQIWPGPDLPTLPNGRASCLTITGADLEPVVAAASSASFSTAWVRGTNHWSITFQHLLPDQSGCADITT